MVGILDGLKLDGVMLGLKLGLEVEGETVG